MPLRVPAVTSRDSIHTMAAVLWAERELLEQLRYGVARRRLALAAGRSAERARFEAYVSGVLNDLRISEVLRAAEAEAVAGELGLPAAATLAELAAAAPVPWTQLLFDHRAALRELVGEVDAASGARPQRSLHAFLA